MAVVTGAGAGIGAATATLLGRQGAAVVVNDVREQAARAVAEQLRRDGATALPAPADAGTEDGGRALIDVALRAHGRVDVLVNAAAALVELKSFEDTAPDEWGAGLSSLYAVLHCTRAALPAMRERRHGRIVNVTSITGVHGVERMAVYGAAKGGTHAFSASLAKEVARDGITVNCVAPGVVDTDRQRQRPEEVRARRRAQIPVGRFAAPDEVAAAVLWFASDEAAYVTGEVLLVDGGRP